MPKEWRGKWKSKKAQRLFNFLCDIKGFRALYSYLRGEPTIQQTSPKAATIAKPVKKIIAPIPATKVVAPIPGNEGSKGGRGNRNGDHQLVMDYLRKIHPMAARKLEIAFHTGISQPRVLIILNNLSGTSNDRETERAAPKDFLVYEGRKNGHTVYGIHKDKELGI